MNVCIISYSVYELDYRVLRYAEALAAEGHAVDVLALLPAGERARRVASGGVRLFRLQRRSYDERHPLQYLWRIACFFVRGALLLLGRHLARPYDVVHVNNIPDFLVFMALGPKLLGSGVILDIHDILPEFFCQKFGKSLESLTARVLLALERISVRFADKLIVANDLWLEKIVGRNALAPADCLALLNYPDLDNFRPARAAARNGDEVQLIYSGTLSRQHGVDLAVRAMAIVAARAPGVSLHIYGRGGELKGELESLIAALDLEQRVHLHEPVPVKKLGSLFGGGQQIGLVTKRDGIFSGEAFSSKIFDYMAAGIPIIASRTRIDEYYFHPGMIRFFQAGSHESLAAGILELCADPALRSALVRGYDGYLRRNNWREKKARYLRLVEEAAGGRP